MTHDIRAALRDALRDAADMLARVKPIDLNVGDDPHGLAARCRALADAPPTVAELLPRVDAAHEVHWTDEDGRYVRVRLGRNPATARLIREEQGDDGWFKSWQFSCSDLTQPATLVEVTP